VGRYRAVTPQIRDASFSQRVFDDVTGRQFNDIAAFEPSRVAVSSSRPRYARAACCPIDAVLNQ
jgi:hypothetical protein